MRCKAKTAGTMKTRSAAINPHRAAPANQPSCDISACSPISWVAMNHAAATPTTAPDKPTMPASMPVSIKVRVGLAPRNCKSATSLRRLSLLDSTINIVSSTATRAPGTPRNRNRTFANNASWRTPSRRAARLLAMTPSPASLANRLLARPVASTKASTGLGASVLWSKLVCNWRTAVCGIDSSWVPKSCSHWAAGSNTTLSGGAVGAACGVEPII